MVPWKTRLFWMSATGGVEMEDAHVEIDRENSKESSGEVDEERRAFFKRCAKAAVVAIPATALVVAMTTKNAHAAHEGCGTCGGGSPH